ncbi:hypothetical protein [Pseudovibrio sp. JE062]|uniref:hypothetical protein n=1 Tax=Pseudovibrio sp. JE062 TaxID=439495 RepID=UPI000186B838|nr:hypothetical protein [Pseudovibrio sp. JE062]EEA94068.1 hypothetical protein PJE062_52 [Pseudovibrio sp. JE062]
MTKHTFFVTSKLKDRKIASLMTALQELLGGSSVSFKGHNLSLSLEAIEKSNTYIISQATLTFQTSHQAAIIEFRRGRTCPPTNIQGRYVQNLDLREGSAFQDEIIFHGDGGLSEENYVSVVKLITSQTKLITTPEVDGKSNVAAEVLIAEITALTDAQKSMIAANDDLRIKNEEAFSARLKKLEDETEVQRHKISEERDRLTFEFQEREKEIDQRLKELDDRDHMHVRRDLREKITNDIGERVRSSLVPPKTNTLGWLVLFLAFGCAAASGYFAYLSYNALMLVSGWDLSLSTNSTSVSASTAVVTSTHMYLMIARTSIASIATLGFLVYALSWLRGMYQRNLQLSNDLQQYALDINRASWTIETIMEMKTKEEHALPEQWIEGACRGLFEKQSTTATEPTAMDALGALLNVTGRLEMGPEGNKLELDKTGLKKAVKQGQP